MRVRAGRARGVAIVSMLAALCGALAACDPGPGSATAARGADWRGLAASLPPANAPAPEHCPVAGASFVDTWLAPRPAGRRHRGVDLFAAEGTPVVAPVGGRVLHGDNDLGGLVFRLWGSDGTYYYGSHLASAGASGWVDAGEVIGTVGRTGNAAATPPHLHLQVHPGFGEAVDPTPVIAAVC
jgi:murein DD-endopeptidase MepM/ murein hydrolase activator NlpD